MIAVAASGPPVSPVFGLGFAVVFSAVKSQREVLN
jgi:hypothetical protein